MKPTDLAAALGITLALCGTSASAQSSGTLSVSVSNVPDNAGTVRLALCRRDEFLKPDCHLHALVPAHQGTSVVDIPNVPAGVYAVQAFQDRDGDGRLKRNFFGIPQEPIGFSRDPVLHFGPPSFDQCAVSISANGSSLALRLRTK